MMQLIDQNNLVGGMPFETFVSDRSKRAGSASEKNIPASGI